MAGGLGRCKNFRNGSMVKVYSKAWVQWCPPSLKIAVNRKKNRPVSSKLSALCTGDRTPERPVLIPRDTASRLECD